MKTLLTLFVLFFSSSVVARTIVIDCEENFSFKVDSDDKVWTKSNSSDYKWVNTGRFILITDNEDEIVIGLKNDYWNNKNGKDKYNRVRISLKTTWVDYFYYYNSNQPNMNQEQWESCTYYK